MPTSVHDRDRDPAPRATRRLKARDDGHALRTLQRLAGNAAVLQLLEVGQDETNHDHLSPVIDVISRSGSPLASPVRAQMENSFGTGFGDVRVHTDSAADRSAQSVNAHAYTVGSSIVFRSGAYDPSSSSGQRTLAHELTHVVQQRSGTVSGTPTSGGISISDPSDRFEREASSTADRVMSVGTSGALGAAPTSLQRVDESLEDEEMTEAGL